jgi:hypothetical protein
MQDIQLDSQGPQCGVCNDTSSALPNADQVRVSDDGSWQKGLERTEQPGDAQRSRNTRLQIERGELISKVSRCRSLAALNGQTSDTPVYRRLLFRQHQVNVELARDTIAGYRNQLAEKVASGDDDAIALYADILKTHIDLLPRQEALLKYHEQRLPRESRKPCTTVATSSLGAEWRWKTRERPTNGQFGP